MQRLELADEVSQSARRFLGARPCRAMPEGTRFGLPSEAERVTQILPNAREFLEFHWSHALGAPSRVERAAEADEITQGLEWNFGVARCQLFGVELPPLGGVKAPLQALERAKLSRCAKPAGTSRRHLYGCLEWIRLLPVQLPCDRPELCMKTVVRNGAEWA
ncbi:MAG TPA: hypothetical protein VFQ35_11880 [Polyangiaceae bacterium]|nr:hypothetical protein [Polyangiaceae bacterium]